MQDIPECLRRRYKATDELIQELIKNTTQLTNCDGSNGEPGVKLMCEFWNILKEHPNLNLRQAVQELLESPENSSFVQPQSIECYMASGSGSCRRSGQSDKMQSGCCSRKDNAGPNISSPKSSLSASSAYSSSAPPLSKALCNLKEAVSFDQKCSVKIKDLMATQKQIRDQIVHLEHREQEGIQLLKQADVMWNNMEESYKKQIAASIKRQDGLLKQLKEAEESNTKWRKNRKDLEFEMEKIKKCHQEIFEKTNQKTSDMKCIDMEIDSLKKRIETNKNDLEAANKIIANKKKASDDTMSKIATEVSKLEKKLKEELNIKKEKDTEGKKRIKEARDNLQNLSTGLLQKKLENEDLKAERDTLLSDIETLKQTFDRCKEKCKENGKTIDDEIKSLDKEIAQFNIKCIRCHQCTDTVDIRKFCTECPRCLEERKCRIVGDSCKSDKNMECVCIAVKQKFLDNIFENMYTVLERHSKAGVGQRVADAVLNCLKRSRNGKLDQVTRNVLQEFILGTIKKNLNLTIIGGAVKTRCEMDQDTYNQLMLCLKRVKVTRPPGVDTGTEVKKDPCPRWGDTSECNCPKGWTGGCVCEKVFPRPKRSTGSGKKKRKRNDAASCHWASASTSLQGCSCDEMSPEPTRDPGLQGEDNVEYPDRDSGSNEESAVGAETASRKSSPCREPTCQFKNMRAAQCVLGPEVLASTSKSRDYDITIPCDTSIIADRITCNCGSSPTIPCTCPKGCKILPCQRIIEEVMGLYSEVSPIDNVSSDFDDAQQLKAVININCNKETNTSLEKPMLNKVSPKMLSVEGVAIDQSKNSENVEVEKSINESGNSTKLTVVKHYLSDECKSDDKIPLTETGNITATNIKLVKKENKDKKTDSDYDKKAISIRSSQPNVPVLEIDEKTANDMKPSTSESTYSKQDSENTKYVLKSINFSKDKKHEIIVELQNDTNDGVSGYLFRTLSGNLGIDLRNDKNISNSASSSVNPPDHNKSSVSNFDKNLASGSLLPLKIKGRPDIESFFLIRKKDSGDYEVVVNKEFEKIIKKTIKDHELSLEANVEYFFKIKESNSGHPYIEIEPQQDADAELKDMIIVKSPSGNVKLLPRSPEIKDDKKYRSSIISQKDFSTLLNKLQIPTEQEQSSDNQRRNIKSKSDSDVHTEIQKNNTPRYIRVNKFLRRTRSGNYILVLWRGLCKRKSSHDMSDLKIPINLNNHVDLNNRCKVSPCGSIYLIIDKDEIHNIVRASSDISMQYDSKENIYITKGKHLKTQTISTCNELPNSACDVTKCVCKYFTSNLQNSIQLYDDNSCKSFQKMYVDEINPFNTIYKRSNEYKRNSCDKGCHKNLSNCNTYISCQCNASKRTISEECVKILDKCNCDGNTMRHASTKENFLLNSLELLPPQLPPFLKGYIR